VIDFRSDTVTRPSPAMRRAMSEAALGDDVYGDDPTVNRVQRKVAERLGFEDALLVPSGTQSNLIALLTHCGRGDEYIVGQYYHTYWYESGGAASLGSINPQPIAVEADGTLALDNIEAVIKIDDVHFTKGRLLSLENTHNGRIINNDYLASAIELAKRHQLAVHLDGARVFNAAVAQNIPVSQITSQFDTVSVCFSKGLGAPIGSMLCGSEAFITQARRWRKMVGGGMRQSGIIAAAIEYALENNVERLAEDHENARELQHALSDIDEIAVFDAQTNMLFLQLHDPAKVTAIVDYLRQRDILISGGKKIRLVTHMDISSENITEFVSQLKQALVAVR
jgi:threonine aldolase